MEKSTKILSEITVYMKYAKFLPNKNKRETWKELVSRNKKIRGGNTLLVTYCYIISVVLYGFFAVYYSMRLREWKG